MREAGRLTRILSLAGCCGLALLALAFAVFVESRTWSDGAAVPSDRTLYLLGPLTVLWASGSTLRTLRDGTAALPLSLACLGAGILSTYLVVSRPVFESLGW
jgi:hypothetical protein